MASDQAPGAEFLLRRLARAQAVPPDQQPPEVPAFVELVQLLREACDLLPLRAEGEPALQLSSVQAQQQVQLAFLKAAWALYLCPLIPVCDRPQARHLEAYMKSLMPQLLQQQQQQLLQHARDSDNSPRGSSDGSWGGSTPSSGSLLEALLLSLLACAFKHDPMYGVAVQSAALLEVPFMRDTVLQQLAQLAAAHPGQKLLSVDQLRYACCQRSSSAVVVKGTKDANCSRHEPASALVQPCGQLSRFIAVSQQLEPHTPKTWQTAADLASEQQNFGNAAKLLRQAARLAKQQGSTLQFAIHAGTALAMARTAALTSSPVAPDCKQQMVSAFQRADQALQRTKRLLPISWVDRAVAVVELARAVIASNEDTSHQHQPLSASAPPTATTSSLPGSLVHALSNTQARLARGSKCDGCGEQAVGLRRCSHCKQAQYCRSERQRQHWRAHKRECREAA